MKKCIGLFIVLMLLGSFSACTPKDTIPPMFIQKATLTKDEKKIIKLLDLDTIADIYDFKVDDKLQSIHINTYELKDGKWEMLMSDSSQMVKDVSGRLALSFNKLPSEFQVSIQSEHHNGTNRYSTDATEDYNNMTRAVSSLNSPTEIVYGKEIPLVMQILTSQNVVSSYTLEHFYNPEVYEKHNYEHVYAITIMFSEKSLGELDRPQ